MAALQLPHWLDQLGRESGRGPELVSRIWHDPTVRGASEADLELAALQAACGRIHEDPAYERLASRLLLRRLYREVLDTPEPEPEAYRRAFVEFLHQGVQCGALDERLLRMDTALLARALEPRRDLLLPLIGLLTLADRYLVREPATRRLLELPQFLFLRVAMGLSLREEQPELWALRFYHAMSRLDIVYLHRHRRLDLAAFVPAFKAAQEEHRPGLVVIGDPEAQERALRDICSVSSLQLGVSTVLVDPQGRVGGRGRVPDKSVGGAAWVPVRDLRELPDVCEALLLHARPRVLVTALDSLADAQRLLRGAGTTMLVAAVPVRSLDPPPQELVELSTSLPLAAAVPRNGKLEPLPDLRRALAKAARR